MSVLVALLNLPRMPWRGSRALDYSNRFERWHRGRALGWMIFESESFFEVVVEALSNGWVIS